MRLVGTIDREPLAQSFADYLLTQGIEARVDRSAEGYSVWALDDDLLAEAKRQFEAFQADPSHRRYADAQAGAQQVRRQQQKREEQARRNTINLRDQWDIRGRGPVTIGLIAVSVVVAVLTRLGGIPEPIGTALAINSYRVEGDWVRWVPGLPDIRGGQVWRTVTPIFLHFNVLHILFNMYWLVELGTMIELRRGSVRFLLLVLWSAACSNLAQYWMSETPLFGGMSGVVYALFGFVWMRSRYEPGQGMFLHSWTVNMMLAWLVLCMVAPILPLFGGVFPRVANTAHAVGLACGLVAGYAPTAWRMLAGRR